MIELVRLSQTRETVIIECSKKVLYLAQNFDTMYPYLENLKKTHFGEISMLI